MKIFQIYNHTCHWDASELYQRVEDTIGFYPASDLFVEAPDCVCEGWLYDETQSGDDRFIPPPIAEELPEPILVSSSTAQDDTDAMLVDHEYRLTLLELGLTE